jgi:hypothetical protein
MTDLDYQVRDIKQRMENARAQRAGAEHEQRVAQASVDQVLLQLKEEFGVSTVAEAKVLLQSLEAQAAAECTAVEGYLEAE